MPYTLFLVLQSVSLSTLAVARKIKMWLRVPVHVAVAVLVLTT